MLGAAIPASDEVERMGEERDAVAAFAPRGRGGAGLRGAVVGHAHAPARPAADCERAMTDPIPSAHPEQPTASYQADARGRPPRAAALQRRPRHERDAQVDPGRVRRRGRGADRQPRPARRGLRGGQGQGAADRRDRVPRGRCPRGVRRRVRAAGDQGQRDLRPRLSAVHRARPAADRQAGGRVRARHRLRHDRPRLHRQGQRPGPDRGDDRHAGARS